MKPDLSCDVLIIGSGGAGLSLALRLANTHSVIVLSKRDANEGSTLYAQGGIAAAFDKADSIESHIDDTLIAGAGLCDSRAVSFVASNARHCVQWLIDQGVQFDTETQPGSEHGYHLTREGGHSHRRILHTADATGKAVEMTLLDKALSHSNIRFLEDCHALDLIISDKIGQPGPRSVVGAWLWKRDEDKIAPCAAGTVVLATGGASKVYQYTTNPAIASGDGIAMAWRAGCRVANMEFNQFHPTALFHPQARNFLLTEALRGEGAYLTRPDGSRFMADFDPRAELAPRDIVTRAIDYEMKRLNADCLYLDISHRSQTFIRQHFPTIHEKLMALGIDMTKEPVPVVPAAHYTCGGVAVDHSGRTDIDGLYAIGEVSYTGLHGANRMASNSLLECLVYGWSAAEDIRKRSPTMLQTGALPAWSEPQGGSADEQIVLQHNLNELRLLMWDYVGIVRTTRRLQRALSRIALLKQELSKYYARFRMSDNLLELRNMVQVAELMVRCAMMREESRGLHFTLDYPGVRQNSGPSLLTPPDYINR